MPGRRNLWLLCAMVGVCLAPLGLVGWLSAAGWLTPVRPVESRRIFSVAGEDSAAAGTPFHVADSWELRWEHTGDLQEIRWTDQRYGHANAVHAMHRKPIRPHGSVNISHGGEYQLEVFGTGQWKLDVYDLSPARP